MLNSDNSQSDERKPPIVNPTIHFLKATERKPSQRLTFIKPPAEVEENRLETVQQNRSRIKDNMKSSLQMIIVRQVQNEPSQDVETELHGKRISEKTAELARKLDLELSFFQSELINLNVQEYFARYEELNVLGEGCIGLVKRVQNRETGQCYASKRVSTTDEEVIRNMVIEFHNMVQLSHDNIVKMHELYIDYNDSFQSESRAYVIMEFVDGKEMFEVINELGHYGEMHAKLLFKQLLSAIEYMHRHGVCHRDLKPHNILCLQESNQIKITDFNVSKFSENYKEFGDLKDLEKIEMWTYTGTVAFSAPEIFTGEGYTQMVDIWSAGCILYSMLSGLLPFNSEYLNDLIENIKKAEISFDLEQFQAISDEAKDLIHKLLQKVPQDRLYPDQALKHPWFENEPGQRRRTLKHNTLRDNIQHLTTRKANVSRQRTIIKQIQFRTNDSHPSTPSAGLQKLSSSGHDGTLKVSSMQNILSVDNFINSLGKKSKFSQLVEQELSQFPSPKQDETDDSNQYLVE